MLPCWSNICWGPFQWRVRSWRRLNLSLQRRGTIGTIRFWVTPSIHILGLGWIYFPASITLCPAQATGCQLNHPKREISTLPLHPPSSSPRKHGLHLLCKWTRASIKLQTTSGLKFSTSPRCSISPIPHLYCRYATTTPTSTSTSNGSGPPFGWDRSSSFRTRTAYTCRVKWPWPGERRSGRSCGEGWRDGDECFVMYILVVAIPLIFFSPAATGPSFLLYELGRSWISLFILYISLCTWDVHTFEPRLFTVPFRL